MYPTFKTNFIDRDLNAAANILLAEILQKGQNRYPKKEEFKSRIVLRPSKLPTQRVRKACLRIKISPESLSINTESPVGTGGSRSNLTS